jgi:hypothetical protein
VMRRPNAKHTGADDHDVCHEAQQL